MYVHPCVVRKFWLHAVPMGNAGEAFLETSEPKLLIHRLKTQQAVHSKVLVLTHLAYLDLQKCLPPPAAAELS